MKILLDECTPHVLLKRERALEQRQIIDKERRDAEGYAMHFTESRGD